MKLYHLLIESRIDFLKDKYIPLIQDYIIKNKPKIKGLALDLMLQPDKYSEYIFNLFIAIDPTKNREYLQWLLNEGLKLSKRDFELLVGEDSYKWKEYLTIYHKVKRKLDISLRDINKIRLFGLKEIGLKYKDSDETLTKNESLDKNYLIYQNSNWKVYKIEGTGQDKHKAACELGSGTEWCTAHSDAYDTFEYYVKSSPLYIFINKHDKSKKYQYHYNIKNLYDHIKAALVQYDNEIIIETPNIDKDELDTEQFMDKDDDPVKLSIKEFCYQQGIPENLIKNQNIIPDFLDSDLEKIVFGVLMGTKPKEEFFNLLRNFKGRIEIRSELHLESPEIFMNLLKLMQEALENATYNRLTINSGDIKTSNKLNANYLEVYTDTEYNYSTPMTFNELNANHFDLHTDNGCAAIINNSLINELYLGGIYDNTSTVGIQNTNINKLTIDNPEHPLSINNSTIKVLEFLDSDTENNAEIEEFGKLVISESKIGLFKINDFSVDNFERNNMKIIDTEFDTFEMNYQ